MAAPMRLLRSCISNGNQYSFLLKYLKRTPKLRVCSYCTSADKAQTFNHIKTRDRTKVLEFFNNCDYVTFIKLKEVEKALYDVDPLELVTIGEISKRFHSVEDIQRRLDILLNPHIARNIERLKVKDTYGLGIKLPLPTQQKQAVKKVVAIDILQHDLIWTEETITRELLTVGCIEAFPEVIKYDHIKYQRQAIEAVEQIPISDIYVFHSNVYAPHNVDRQVCLEALISTLLNSRCDGKYSLPGDTNKVFEVRDTLSFYDLDTYGHTQWILENFLNNEPGPLSGIEMADIARENIKCASLKPVSMTKCLLLSDMVCRCLTKLPDHFPRAYSVHRGI